MRQSPEVITQGFGNSGLQATALGFLDSPHRGSGCQELAKPTATTPAGRARKQKVVEIHVFARRVCEDNRTHNPCCTCDLAQSHGANL